MRIIITLICILLAISACNNKPRTESSNLISQSDNSHSRYLFSPVFLSTKIDSLNKKPITYYLNHPDMDSIVLKIYYGELIPTYKHIDYMYYTSLKHSYELQPFFDHLSNYVSEVTKEEGNVIQLEREKIRRQEFLEKIEIETLNGLPITFYINHPDLDSLIKDLYAVKFLPSDDDKTFKLLDLLSDKHPDLYPFYIHCMNQICRYSDGALSEIMGTYCIEIVQNYPKYFFTKNKDYICLYAEFIGYELYFEKKGTSSINGDYNTFIKQLQTELDTTDIKIKESLLTFDKTILDVFKRMEN